MGDVIGRDRMAHRRNMVAALRGFERLSEWGDQWVRDHCAEMHFPDGDEWQGDWLQCGEPPGHAGPHRHHEDRRHTWRTT